MTHCKHNSLVSSLVSTNQSRRTHIWMYVCWVVCQDTYPDIWVGRVIIIWFHLIIHCVVLQYGLYTLGLRWHGVKVYIWEFSYLNYSFEVLISWSHKLGLYDWFCLYAFLSVLWCFFSLGDTQVRWTQNTVTWDICYIYEDFLVWIIPLTY